MTYNEFEKAIECFEKSISIKEDNDSYYNIGICQRSL